MSLTLLEAATITAIVIGALSAIFGLAAALADNLPERIEARIERHLDQEARQ